MTRPGEKILLPRRHIKKKKKKKKRESDFSGKIISSLSAQANTGSGWAKSVCPLNKLSPGG